MSDINEEQKRLYKRAEENDIKLLQDKYTKQKQVLDKIKEYCKEVIEEHNKGEYNVSTTQLAIKEHKGNIENILELLEEIE